MKASAHIVALVVLGIASSSLLRAQQAPAKDVTCSQMPNECCPPESANAMFSASSSSSDINFAQFQQGGSNFQIDGPLSQSMMDSGTVALQFSSNCRTDDNIRMPQEGRNHITVATYGNAEVRIELAELPDGLAGLAGLYHRVLVVDVSAVAWTGG